MSQPSDRNDLKAAIKRQHTGNLHYGNYTRRVFVIGDKQANPVSDVWSKKPIDGNTNQASSESQGFTLDPGEGDNMVLLQSGDVAIRTDPNTNHYRTVDIDTASEDEFLRIHAVMRKWAPLAGYTVKPLGAK